MNRSSKNGAFFIQAPRPRKGCLHEQCELVAVDAAHQLVDVAHPEASCLAVLGAHRLLAALQAVGAAIAAVGRHGHELVLPLARSNFVGADLREMYAPFVGLETQMLLARDLAGVAAGAVLVID